MSRTEAYLAELRARVPARSRADIMANILKETRSNSMGARKTRLMYRCNLSFRQLKIYLKILVDKRFLKVVYAKGSSKKFEIYHITEEGLSFLKAYNELVDRLGEKALPP